MKMESIKLDQWQLDVLEDIKAKKNLCICCGRQVGKSTIVSYGASEYLVANKDKSVLIISVTEDQAELMLQKILLYLSDKYKNCIKKGKDKPTKHMIKLTNGSEVRCKAVGQSGIGVLGLTIDLLIADEAAYMPEAVFYSVSPMLLTTAGNMILISTPNIQEGYFYEAYTNSDFGFKTYHINSEQVAEQRAEPFKTIMKQYLDRERLRMSELQYAQQYLAQFLEELRQLFPDELIKRCMQVERDHIVKPDIDYFLGVDVARMGGDETTFEIIKKTHANPPKLVHVENMIRTKVLTTDTAQKILELDQMYNFKRIYIDDGGLGVAVFDYLLSLDQTKRKIVAINNSARSLDKDNKRRKKLLKEDLYMNLLRLMEQGVVQLLKDDEVFLSLKSVVVEENQNTNEIRIYGRYTHVCEAIIRACWCVKEKDLNFWVYSI